MSLEYYTVESLGSPVDSIIVSDNNKNASKKDNRDMSLEALIQTQIIQQDGKLST